METAVNQNHLWVIKFVLLSLFFLFYLLTNILIDPSGLLRPHQEMQIASWLHQGFGVVNAINTDYRQIVKERVQLLDFPPDIVVLGSSRSMVVDSSFYPNQHFLNFGLPSANLEDILANYNLLYEHDKLPKKILWCMDLHYFNAYYKSQFHLFREYRRCLSRMDIEINKTITDYISEWIEPRYFQVFSPAYFQESFRLIPSYITGKLPRPTPVQDFETVAKLIKPDGSIVYEESKRVQDQQRIDWKAERYAFKHPEGLINYRELNKERQILFERFIDLIQSDGVNLEVLFVPMHPRTYEILIHNENYKIILKVEEYIVSVLKAKNIKYCGSFDPTRCGCKNTDFYDAVHAKPEALKRILGV